MILEGLLKEFKIEGLTEEGKVSRRHVWRRLKPWPDSVEGLTLLKKKYVIAPLSNGNVALMTSLAKFGGLPWDVNLGAELARHYKPDREVYASAATTPFEARGNHDVRGPRGGFAGRAQLRSPYRIHLSAERIRRRNSRACLTSPNLEISTLFPRASTTWPIKWGVITPIWDGSRLRSAKIRWRQTDYRCSRRLALPLRMRSRSAAERFELIDHRVGIFDILRREVVRADNDAVGSDHRYQEFERLRVVDQVVVMEAANVIAGRDA